MTPDEQPDFEALLTYLKRTRGFDFTGYKRPTLTRRVTKRLGALGVSTFAEYVDYLEVHPEEFACLFNTILINVTGFFRDPEAWEFLRAQILPPLLESKAADEPIRAWSAGCASGEEAYTLAIVLAEALGVEAFKRRVKIYATDVDDDALLQARSASYKFDGPQDLPLAFIDKYFEHTGDRYVFRSDLRRSIIFGRHDLFEDAPISRLDLLVCRNTLMYFNAEAQSRIVARFHFALNERGCLFLGKAEMLLTYGQFFTPIDLGHRLFSRSAKMNLRDRLLVLAQAGDAEATGALGRQVRLREAAFESAPIPQIIVDSQGNVALINEQARLLLSLSPEDVGRPLQDLEVSYRPVELRGPIEQAYAERRPVLLSKVERRLADGTLQTLDVQVRPLHDSGTALGVSLTFQDMTRYHALNALLQTAHQELETANEELQSANEELETTNEELQSTIEELETTNEELQSTNEEMETMNEELQSTNEELQTINDELRQRTTDLNTTNAFLESILTSVRAGVMVVDRACTIRIWNRQAEELWGLRADEVIGQSLGALDIGLPVADLIEALRAFMSGADHFQTVTWPVINRRGRAFTCRVQLSPLIGVDKQRSGVVVLMEEVGA